MVNVGAHDGKSFDDPCFPLFERGYSGVAIEGTDNPNLFKNLPSPDIQKITGCFVTPQNIADVLEKASTPKHVDYLKIDIDGYDGPVLAAILEAGYRPKLIQVEINPEIPPPFEFSVMYHPNYLNQDATGRFTGFYGMSLSYAARIARHYGYHLIYMDNITPATHDILLAKNELADLLGSDPQMSATSLRRRYLAHPLPACFHFSECGFDPMKWRYRTDYAALAVEIWYACLTCCAAKHQGQARPFYMSMGS